MSKVYSKVYLDSGETLNLDYDPAELIEKFTDKNGNIRDEFMEIGTMYVNPKHVAMISYNEEKPGAKFTPKPPGW